MSEEEEEVAGITSISELILKMVIDGHSAMDVMQFLELNRDKVDEALRLALREQEEEGDE